MMMRPILFVACVLSSELFAEGRVLDVEQSDRHSSLPFLIDMADEACKGDWTDQDCSVAQGVEFQWGAGFCEHTREALAKKMERSDIRLAIDGQRIPPSRIASFDSHEDRQSYRHCHQWLVRIKGHQAGSAVLESLDGKSVISTTRLVIRPTTE